MVENFSKLTRAALSRRGFLAGTGAVAAATLTGCGNSSTFTVPTSTTPAPSAVTDVDVLNFALNLEYLEAEYYLRGATGAGIPAADQLSGAGAVTVKTGSQVTFKSPLTMGIANEIAQTELQHVRAIQATIKALGGTPVSAPALDFTAGFNGAAMAAKLGSTFDPFASEENFFIGALTFEDVGVSAYTGAAGLISNAAVLSAAAGIQAAEAYHAGSLRTYLVGASIRAGNDTLIQTFAAIQAVRASLGGGNETTLTSGVNSSNNTFVTGSTIVNADTTNSIAYARTTDQVLHIVYEATGAGLAKGGFFPAGLNGNIKTTTA